MPETERMSAWQVLEGVGIPAGVLLALAGWFFDIDGLAMAGLAMVAIVYGARLVGLARQARRGDARVLDRHALLGRAVVGLLGALLLTVVAAVVGVVTALVFDLPVLRGTWHATRAMLIFVAGAASLSLLEYSVKRRFASNRPKSRAES